MWGCEIISDKETISGAPGFTGFDNTQIRGHQLKLSEGRFLLNDKIFLTFQFTKCR